MKKGSLLRKWRTTITRKEVKSKRKSIKRSIKTIRMEIGTEAKVHKNKLFKKKASTKMMMKLLKSDPYPKVYKQKLMWIKHMRINRLLIRLSMLSSKQIAITWCQNNQKLKFCNWIKLQSRSSNLLDRRSLFCWMPSRCCRSFLCR